MKSTNKSTNTLWLLIVAIFIVTIIGCKNDNDDDILPDPPPLPPITSLAIDFQEIGNPDDTLSARDINTYINWGRAYFDVAAWNLVVSSIILVPVASYAIALNQTPVYNPVNGEWIWAYEFTSNNITYSAKLKGYYDGNDSVAWEMRITQQGGFVDFLWYYGKMHIAGNQIDYVYWELVNNPVDNIPFLRIDWNRLGSGATEWYTTKYTIIDPDNPSHLDWISYMVSPSEFFRVFTLFDVSEWMQAQIEFYVNTHEGKIKDPWFFGDEEWHCWDTNLMDVICP